MAGAVLLGAAACSKKDDASSSTNATSSGGGSSSTTKAAGGGGTGTTAGGGSTDSTAGTSGDTISLKKTFWTAGFKVTISDEVYDSKKGTLTFNLETENLTQNDTPLYSTFALEADGAQLTTGNLEDGKAVLKGNKAKNQLVFNSMGAKFETKYDPAKTTLVIGAGDEQKVRIQLDGKGTKDVLNKPIDQDFKTSITIGQATFNIDKTQVRYDNVPHAGNTAKEGHVYLVMTGSWKNDSSDNMIYLSKDDIILKSSDGTEYTPDSFDSETSLAKTKKDDKMALIYDLEDKFAGDWTITFTQKFGADNTEVTESKTFSLKADSGGDSGSSTGTTKAS